MTKTPLGNAKWISPAKECDSPVIVKKFNLDSVAPDAKIYITGLGFFEASINGKKITNDKFIPLITDYEKREFKIINYPCRDTMTYRIYFCEFDIADLLKEGENTLEVQLGTGWYRQIERISEGYLEYSDRLKAIFSIVSGDQEICSDGSEMWYPSEITYTQLFIGEVIDASLIDAVKELKPVDVLPDTESILSPQIGTPDREIRTLPLTKIAEVGGKAIYDAGENISGVVRITTKAGYTGRVVLRFAENLNDDKSLNFNSCGDAGMRSGRKQHQTDEFICDGQVRTLEPKFTWHAFRYVEADGEFESAEVAVIHSDCPVITEFDSSSEGLNYLYETYIRTQLDNMHGSIPSDCPHRERLGYTGDGQVCAPVVMSLLDTKEFYRKWIRDILDCQDITRGHIQHTAPFMGGGGGPSAWGGAIVSVPYAFYKHYGDVSIINETYDAMVKYLGYMMSNSEDYLIVREEEGGWCLGDWATRETIAIPEAYVNSAYLVRLLGMMTEMARVIGCYEDTAEYERLSDCIRDSVKRHYYADGHFCGGIQGADAYAYDIGLADEDMIRAFAEKYDKLGYFDTGFVANPLVTTMLFENGYADVAMKLFESEEMGSYLYMKRHGATTIWENWNADSSHNHPMQGAPVLHLFTDILGIKQAEDSVGYKSVVINPAKITSLGYARGSMITPSGKISVDRCGDDYTIEIPEGINASFVYGDIKTPLSCGVNKISVK